MSVNIGTKATVGFRKSFLFDNATATNIIAQNQIAAASLVNNDSAALASGNSVQIIGVTAEPTDTYGYAAVQLNEIAQVRVGSTNISVGQKVTSDANGNATPFTPSASGTVERGVLGTALQSATAGNLVDVLIVIGTSNG